MNATQQQLSAIAEFNQLYGDLLRELQRNSLQSSKLTATGRVLLALGRRVRASSRELSSDLNMDPAQLSRLLFRLVDEGHVVSLPDAGDRRVGALTLTQSGDAAAAEIEAGQIQALQDLVGHLDAGQIETLIAAMDLIGDLLVPEQT